MTTDKCYMEPESGKGYIVYNEYEECQESWLLLPGFSLLSDGMLIGKFRIARIFTARGLGGCFFVPRFGWDWTDRGV